MNRIKRIVMITAMFSLIIVLSSCGEDSSPVTSPEPEEPIVPSFLDGIAYPAGDYPHALAAGDFDGDGDQDLAIANKAWNTVSILTNDGGASFVTSGYYNVQRWPESACASDLDGDGDLDLVTADNHGNTISVLIGNGDATFQSVACYVGVTDGVIGTSSGTVIAADLDGDGDDDVACTNMHSGVISVLMNSGDGTLESSVQYPAGNGPVSLCAADLDSDGDRDIAVSNIYSHDVSILVNDGGGTFEATGSHGADLWQFLAVRLGSIVPGDLDGDGDIDLAVAGNNGLNACILLNNGDATFSGAVIYYGTSEGTSSLVAADLDGDGDTDLAVANELDDDVTVLLNRGDAVFVVLADYAVGDRPLSIIAGELDGDGDPDLAAVNYGTDDVTVLLNSTGD
jgi:hypothetical protein